MMAKHRASPTCASCHAVMDPLGLALENFDATGIGAIVIATPVSRSIRPGRCRMERR